MEKYTLIVTEKPDAANRIAMALDEGGKPKKAVSNGVPYYQAYRDGNIVVVPALGHLYTITSKQKGRGYPVFDYQWVPRYQAERGASRIRVWLKVIAQLAKDAEGFVDACDFDIEGSIIGYTILKYACGGKEATAKRMKYSTLTKEELQESYTHLLPALDFALVEAGLTRHEVDWLYGINLSRALTQAAQNCSGQYATLSAGRVQGPTLRFLEAREKTINCFVPTPYWTITAKISINDAVFEVEYEKTLENKAQATAVKDACKTKEGQIGTVDVKEFEQNPPVPFDLGSLQSEAYRIFKYTPMRTSSILQHLYLDALISYPRTSSQKLPPSIGYKTILKKLGKAPAYAKHTAELLSKTELKPIEGKKYDPAHPAIYPTGNLPEKPLDTAERNVFDLVVKRFLAVFGEPAILQSINVTISLNGNLFYLNATRTLTEGWLRLYKPYVQLKDSALPPLTEGQKVSVKKIALNNHFTKPPARYNPRSLLLKMEKEEIGTKATRAATIQTLYDRKYLSGTDSLFVSDLGFEVIEVLSKYCPTVVSPELTRKLEGEMNEIQQGNQTKEKVLQNATEILKQVTSELKQKEAAIGAQLSQPLQKAKLDERTVGACPKCHEGKLVVLRSKKSGKRFVGCTNYFEGKCNAAFPLPQTGTVKPLSSVCKSCGSPTVAVYLRGRRPWKLCLNPDCPSKGASKQ
ncbi:MAG: DNA topoisomerase I [Chloroflexi bacterium]|nr:DNA topoisomerase I [Chloroflexota bacterium]MCL5949013.1 DNA topoisomerase I [Candidatus Bathyarchaeota archaeon]